MWLSLLLNAKWKSRSPKTKTLESEARPLRLQNRSYFLKYELDRLHTSLPVIFWLGYLLRRGEKHIILSALVMSCLYLRRLSHTVGGAEQSLSQSGPIEAPVHQILDVPHTRLASGGQDSWTFITSRHCWNLLCSCEQDWHIWVQNIYQIQKLT